jgi:hypothetical protein
LNPFIERRWSFGFYESTIAIELNRNFPFDVRIGIIVHEFEVFVLKIENIFHIGIDDHFGQGARLARKLQFHLFQMIQINVGIAHRVNKISFLQTRYLRHHFQQQGVRGNVEWDAQKNIGAALVKLQAQFAVGNIKLKEHMTGWKVHVGQIGHVPRTEIISANAQWFEDNSPVDPQFKKEKVKGVSAKVITAAMLGGDCYPATPIGINLPNSNWIRRDYGSKSVTIENITDAYDKAAEGNGFNEEFMWSEEEIERAKKYGSITNNLHTDLHECLGHGSGKMLPGVHDGALKEYESTIEEARADLFGLYYLADPKMIELGLLPDSTAYKAQYYSYLMNGLMTQLTRIQPGKNIEEAHMRNRQLIARYVYEQSKADKAVEMKQRDGKTFVVVNDYGKIRERFGQLLSEIQRIKSTGDYHAAKKMVETYAVKVDPALHKEVLARYEALNLAPYKGFVNPVYRLVTDKNGKVTDVTVSYDENYVEQNLRYSKEYSVLPLWN